MTSGKTGNGTSFWIPLLVVAVFIMVMALARGLPAFFLLAFVFTNLTAFAAVVLVGVAIALYVITRPGPAPSDTAAAARTRRGGSVATNSASPNVRVSLAPWVSARAFFASTVRAPSRIWKPSSATIRMAGRASRGG